MNLTRTSLFSKFEIAVWTNEEFRNHTFDATIRPSDNWEPHTAEQDSPSRVRRLCIDVNLTLYQESLESSYRMIHTKNELVIRESQTDIVGSKLADQSFSEGPYIQQSSTRHPRACIPDLAVRL